jgi:hypothetical protein
MGACDTIADEADTGGDIDAAAGAGMLGNGDSVLIAGVDTRPGNWSLAADRCEARRSGH